MDRRFEIMAVCGVLLSAVLCSAATPPQDRMELLRDSSCIVFLGDSITFGGRYVACFDAWLATQDLQSAPKVIDAGLSSETVSGLSEDGHAGGRFPRPDLAERLDRVLGLTKPDLVFCCYGINCGIYQPLDEGRFQRYQEGILNLKRHVEAIGGKLVVVTPPLFDDQVAKKSFSYNAVLDHYSEWLLSKRDAGWSVIDLHGPMTSEVARRRQVDPAFGFQRDAVHPNAEGHWFMAQQLIRWFGDEQAAAAETPEAMLESAGIPAEAMELFQQKMSVLRNAYVGAAGHKRPGVKPGLPVDEAEEQATQLVRQIQTMVK